jgi:hypothetical protein
LKLGGFRPHGENVAHPPRVLYAGMINVELGKLACSGLEGQFGDLEVGARKALLHYAYKLRVSRKPVPAPRFLETASEPEAKFELTLDRDSEALLAQEAARQHTTVTRLATHAVMIYLAELEFLGVAPRRHETAPNGEDGS